MSLFYGCSVVLSDADFSYSALFLVLGRLLPQHGYYSRTVVLRLLEWKYKSLVSDSQYHSSLFQWRFFFLVKEFIVFLLYFLLFPIVFGRPTSNLISYIKTFFFPLQVVAAVQRCIHYGESCERLSDQPTNLQSEEQQQQNSGE